MTDRAFRARVWRRLAGALAAFWAAVALAIVLLAGGCAHRPPQTVTVQGPVAVPCPPPPIVNRPALPLSDLTPESGPDAVMRAYAASVAALMGYAAELERLLDGYRQLPEAPHAR